MIRTHLKLGLPSYILTSTGYLKIKFAYRLQRCPTIKSLFQCIVLTGIAAKVAKLSTIVDRGICRFRELFGTCGKNLGLGALRIKLTRHIYP